MEEIRSSFVRYETKYLITQAQYEALKQGMAGHTVPDVFTRYTVSNLYLDTDEYRLIRDSLEKPRYKEKLRLRSYGRAEADQTVFLEMKKKLNSVVFKRRIELPLREAKAYLEEGVRPSNENQICREIDWMRRCYDLRPKVCIRYEREAFSGTAEPDLRITFDTDIRWQTADPDLGLSDGEQPLDLGGKILLEVKFSQAFPFWLSRLMNELDIRRVSFSKYGEVYKRHLFYRPEPPVQALAAAVRRSGTQVRLRNAATAVAVNLL